MPGFTQLNETEAVKLYRDEVTWWQVPKDEAEKQQEFRRDSDEWEDFLNEWLSGREETTVKTAAKRLKYGEHWSVRYDREANHSVLTRMEGSRWVRYNWNLLPGQEQVYTFPDRVTAGKAMARCMRQVYRQNMAVSPTTRNWIIAPNYDGLGFTLRRRQC